MNNLAESLYQMGQKEEAKTTLRKAISTDPGRPFIYMHLARIEAMDGDRKAAEDILKQGVQSVPGDMNLSLQLSWMLATSPDAALRNGAQAVTLAEDVSRRAPNPESFDVLSAAYAETGQFDKAIQIAEQAKSIAASRGQIDIAQRIDSHLKSFRSKQPYRE